VKWTLVTGRGVYRASIPHEYWKTVAPGGFTIGIRGWDWYPQRVIVHRRKEVRIGDCTAFYEEIGEESP
jgi:hypothetical protein